MWARGWVVGVVKVSKSKCEEKGMRSFSKPKKYGAFVKSQIKVYFWILA